MTPQVKKILSALFVAVLGAVLVVLGHLVPSLPVYAQAGAFALLSSVAHYLNAWGHAQRVDELVTAKVTAAIDAEVVQ